MLISIQRQIKQKAIFTLILNSLCGTILINLLFLMECLNSSKKQLFTGFASVSLSRREIINLGEVAG